MSGVATPTLQRMKQRESQVTILSNSCPFPHTLSYKKEKNEEYLNDSSTVQNTIRTADVYLGSHELLRFIFQDFFHYQNVSMQMVSYRENTLSSEINYSPILNIKKIGEWDAYQDLVQITYFAIDDKRQYSTICFVPKIKFDIFIL